MQTHRLGVVFLVICPLLYLLIPLSVLAADSKPEAAPNQIYLPGIIRGMGGSVVFNCAVDQPVTVVFDLTGPGFLSTTWLYIRPGPPVRSRAQNARFPTFALSEQRTVRVEPPPGWRVSILRWRAWLSGSVVSAICL